MGRWIDQLPGLVPSAKSEGIFGSLALLDKNIGRRRQSTDVVGDMRNQTVRDGINGGQRCNENEAVCAGEDARREEE